MSQATALAAASAHPDARAASAMLSCPTLTRSGGGACNCESQARRNSSVPLVPPKPKLFLAATSIFISRAVLAQ